MPLLQTINLGFRFVLELCLLAALGYWGFQLDQGWFVRLAAALGAPLLAGLMWGMFVAPKASHLLADPWRFGLEGGLFALGAAALFASGWPLAAIALFSLFLVNRLILSIWGYFG